MPRPRNNIMRLSAAARQRLCELLDDGATYGEVREDELIAAETAAAGLTLHNASFQAYAGGVEFDEFRRRRREWGDKFARRRMAAALVDGEKATDKLAAIADYLLMEHCIEELEAGVKPEAKELQALSAAVASYNRNRIAEGKEDGKRAAAAREAEYQARIAELSAQIVAMSEKVNGSIDSSRVAAELDAALGVR